MSRNYIVVVGVYGKGCCSYHGKHERERERARERQTQTDLLAIGNNTHLSISAQSIFIFKDTRILLGILLPLQVRFFLYTF
jgi:hypothetical protein